MHWNILLIITMNESRSFLQDCVHSEGNRPKTNERKTNWTPSAVESYEEEKKLFPDFKIFSALSCYSSANPFYPWDDLISS